MWQGHRDLTEDAVKDVERRWLPGLAVTAFARE